MNALKELKDLINIEKITAITTSTANLSINETLELMKNVNIEDLNVDLTFWTKDDKVIVEEVEDEWSLDELILVKHSLKPEKGLVKGVPESVTKVWKDPETGKAFPFKTNAYHDREMKKKEEKEKLDRQRDEDFVNQVISKTEANKAHFENLSTIENNPFTIIEGGYGNRCRYITLPKDFPFSEFSYGLIGEFYSGMDKELRNVVDLSGIAIVNDYGELEVVSRYAPLEIKENYPDKKINALKNYNELYSSLAKDGKIVKVVGFCAETISYNMGTLDEVAENLRNELMSISKNKLS